MVRNALWSAVPRDVAHAVEERLAGLEEVARAAAAEARVHDVCTLLDSNLPRGLNAYALTAALCVSTAVWIATDRAPARRPALGESSQ